MAVKLTDIKMRNYSLLAGQYFPVKIEYVEMEPEEFTKKMTTYQEELDELFDKGYNLQNDIRSALRNVRYEKNKN